MASALSIRRTRHQALQLLPDTARDLLPPHLPDRLAGRGRNRGGIARAAARAAAGAIGASPASGRVSIWSIAVSSLIASPVRSVVGVAFRAVHVLRDRTADGHDLRAGAAGREPRVGTLQGRTAQAGRYTVSCSCWLALDRICSTSARVQSSRLLARSWYCCCKASFLRLRVVEPALKLDDPGIERMNGTGGVVGLGRRGRRSARRLPAGAARTAGRYARTCGLSRNPPAPRGHREDHDHQPQQGGTAPASRLRLDLRFVRGERRVRRQGLRRLREARLCEALLESFESVMRD